jgi:hypothetical protein
MKEGHSVSKPQVAGDSLRHAPGDVFGIEDIGSTL